MQHIHVLRGIAVLALAALGACDTTGSTSAPDPVDPADEVARQVEAMGFRSDMIEDFGGHVLVEGDIMISKAQLRSAVRRRTSDPMGPRFHYHTTNLVGSPKVNQIQVDLSALNPQPAWQTAAAQALTHWSGISNSYVRLVEGESADITVRPTCTAFHVAAYASFPSGGSPGITVFVNTCFGYSTSPAQKLRIMAHEFGHTLGFRHSNYVQNGESAGPEGAVHVGGTPTSGNDPGSVMNGGTALTSWAGFSAADLAATTALYPAGAPLPPPVSQALPQPVLSVSNSGGHPLITWTAPPGATSYFVFLLERETLVTKTLPAPEPKDYYTSLGSTSGTSFLDTTRAYTGKSMCSGSGVRYTYQYMVTALFPDGTSTNSYFAPVGPC